MTEMYNRGPKHMHLNIEDSERLYEVARALSNPVRIQIMQALGKKSMRSVNELAESLDVPISTIALGGGYIPFALDVTHLLGDGESGLCLRAEDQPDYTA